MIKAVAIGTAIHVMALSVQEQEAQALVEEVQHQAEPEEIDIDLNDPEVEKAAVKIQATFKGYHTRKEMQEHKEHEHVRGSLC